LDSVMTNLQPGQEFYYNDALKLMLKDQKHVLAVEIMNGKYYDTGNKIEYMKTVVEFALRHPEINGEFKRFLNDLRI